MKTLTMTLNSGAAADPLDAVAMCSRPEGDDAKITLRRRTRQGLLWGFDRYVRRGTGGPLWQLRTAVGLLGHRFQPHGRAQLASREEGIGAVLGVGDVLLDSRDKLQNHGMRLGDRIPALLADAGENRSGFKQPFEGIQAAGRCR